MNLDLDAGAVNVFWRQGDVRPIQLTVTLDGVPQSQVPYTWRCEVFRKGGDAVATAFAADVSLAAAGIITFTPTQVGSASLNGTYFWEIVRIDGASNEETLVAGQFISESAAGLAVTAPILSGAIEIDILTTGEITVAIGVGQEVGVPDIFVVASQGPGTLAPVSADVVGGPWPIGLTAHSAQLDVVMTNTGARPIAQRVNIMGPTLNSTTTFEAGAEFDEGISLHVWPVNTAPGILTPAAPGALTGGALALKNFEAGTRVPTGYEKQSLDFSGTVVGTLPIVNLDPGEFQWWSLIYLIGARTFTGAGLLAWGFAGEGFRLEIQGIKV